MNEDKATRYHRRRRRTGVMAAAATAVTLVALVGSGATSVLAALAERMSGAASGEPHDWPGLAAFVVPTLVFAVLVGVPVYAARFPFDVFREWTLDRAYDLERVPFRTWFGGYLRGVLVQGALVCAAMLAIRSCAWAGAAWWVAASLALWSGYLAWTHAAPLILFGFGALTPLARPHVVERLRALGERAGAMLDVYEWRGGDDSRRAHAALGGVGRTRRVILSDTLLESLTVDEIEVVVAHELAHHVHGDVWRSSLWRLFTLTAGMAAANVAIAQVPGQAPLDPRQLAALPVIVGAVVFASAMLSPIGYALSRAQERRADVFAVDATGNTDAFLTSMRRLAASNLVEERPSRFARLLSSHPPIEDRMAAVVTRPRFLRPL